MKTIYRPSVLIIGLLMAMLIYINVSVVYNSRVGGCFEFFPQPDPPHHLVMDHPIPSMMLAPRPLVVIRYHTGRQDGPLLLARSASRAVNGHPHHTGKCVHS